MNKPNLFEAALAEEGITGRLADVARSIYMQESGGGKNTKTSNAGAMGGMQIIPSTFKSVADSDWDISNPEHNARAGIRYLAQLDKMSGGDSALTAAGYYGGPRGMEKARKGIAVSDPRNPNAPNTLQYAEQVVGRLPQGKAPVPVGETNPVVLAQAEEVPLAPAPVAVPASIAAPAATGWEEMQKVPAQPVQVADLRYGAGMPMPQINPLQYMGNNQAVNFAAFRRLKGRA